MAYNYHISTIQNFIPMENTNKHNTLAEKLERSEQSFINVLSEKVILKRCVNNQKIYISEECPFCGKKGKKNFRYNTKLRVGKSYCCGVSFKDLSWLKKRLDPTFDYDKFQIDNKHDLYKTWSDEKIEDYKKFLKDKLSMIGSRFEKSNKEDDDLPF